MERVPIMAANARVFPRMDMSISGALRTQLMIIVASIPVFSRKFEWYDDPFRCCFIGVVYHTVFRMSGRTKSVFNREDSDCHLIHTRVLPTQTEIYCLTPPAPAFIFLKCIKLLSYVTLCIPVKRTFVTSRQLNVWEIIYLKCGESF